MKAKEEEIEELKSTMNNFSEKNGDIIHRVTLVTALLEQGKVTCDDQGVYHFNDSNA